MVSKSSHLNVDRQYSILWTTSQYFIPLFFFFVFFLSIWESSPSLSFLGKDPSHTAGSQKKPSSLSVCLSVFCVPKKLDLSEAWADSQKISPPTFHVFQAGQSWGLVILALSSLYLASSSSSIVVVVATVASKAEKMLSVQKYILYNGDQ